MKYRVEFDDNVPVRAMVVRSASRITNLTDFGEKEGKSFIAFLYVDAETERDAIRQAQRIVTAIFKF
jgi:hypothetical protein